MTSLRLAASRGRRSVVLAASSLGGMILAQRRDVRAAAVLDGHEGRRRSLMPRPRPSTPKPRLCSGTSAGRDFSWFGLQQPAAPAGCCLPVAFAATLGRVLLYQGLDVLVALFGHWSPSQRSLMPHPQCTDVCASSSPPASASSCSCRTATQSLSTRRNSALNSS